MISPDRVVRMMHPTSISGTAGPTSDPVIRPGTKMSTFGRLTVLTAAGQQAPYAGQRVLIQTRPRSATNYSAVATAVTTRTGYYYTNWSAQVDADVRVVFASPYQTVRSAYRWLRVVDVH